MLKEWASGIAGAWLTIDAKLALDRLARGSSVPLRSPFCHDRAAIDG